MECRTIRFSLAALCAAGLLGSCSMGEKLVEPSNVQDAAELTLEFATDLASKTAFGAPDADSGMYPAYWTESDSKLAMSLGMNGIVSADIHKDAAVSNKATFSATFPNSGAPYNFHALSPIGAVSAISPSRGAWSVNIPAVQKPSSDGLSCDQAAMLLYGSTGEMGQLPKGRIDMQFSHATSYLVLTLGNIAAGLSAKGAGSAAVKGVELSFSAPVAGDWYLDPATGELTAGAAVHTITIDTPIADPSAVAKLWVGLAPCNLDGGKVRVSVLTTAGQLVRTYNYSTRSYLPGTVNRLSLDMSKNCVLEPLAGDIAVLAREQYGMYLKTGETLYTPYVSQLSREYAAGLLTFSIIMPADGVSLDFSGISTGAAKGDSFELTVNKVQSGKQTLVGKYSVKVVKEEGSKLWLADAEGNGFIIKR